MYGQLDMYLEKTQVFVLESLGLKNEANAEVP